MPAVFALSRFTDAMAAFSLAYPRIALELHYSDERKELIGSGLDVAIRMGVDGKNSISSRILFTEPLCLIATPEYIATRPAITVPDALNHWDWIGLLGVHSQGLVFKNANKATVTIRPDIRINSNDVQSLYRLAKFGAGVTVVPEFLTKEDVAKGRMQHVLPTWSLKPIQVWADWPANAPKAGLIQLLIDSLSQNTTAPDQIKASDIF